MFVVITAKMSNAGAGQHRPTGTTAGSGGGAAICSVEPDTVEPSSGHNQRRSATADGGVAGAGQDGRTGDDAGGFGADWVDIVSIHPSPVDFSQLADPVVRRHDSTDGQQGGEAHPPLHTGEMRQRDPEAGAQRCFSYGGTMVDKDCLGTVREYESGTRKRKTMEELATSAKRVREMRQRDPEAGAQRCFPYGGTMVDKDCLGAVQEYESGTRKRKTMEELATSAKWVRDAPTRSRSRGATLLSLRRHDGG